MNETEAALEAAKNYEVEQKSTSADEVDDAYGAAKLAATNIMNIIADAPSTAGSDVASQINAVITKIDSAIASTSQQFDIEISGAKEAGDIYEVSTTTAQVDKATLIGSVEAGDSFSISIDGNAVTYTVLGNEANMNLVRDGLINALNSNATVSKIIEATKGSSSEILLTAQTPGVAMTTVLSSTDNGSSSNGFKSLENNVSNYNVSATYKVTGNEADLAAIREGLLGAINSSAAGSLLTASNGFGSGDIVLKSDATDSPAFSVIGLSLIHI